MQPLNVVIIGSELPYPPTAGNRIRTLNLALRLARRHRITFVAQSSSESQEAASYLQGKGLLTHLVDGKTPSKTGPLFYARLAANLVSPLPFSAQSQGIQGLRAAIRSLPGRDEVDLWQVESIFVFDALTP